MYRIWFVNFQYFAVREFNNLPDAIQHAGKCGFQALIYKNDIPVGEWDVFDGYKERLHSHVDGTPATCNCGFPEIRR